MIKHLLLLSITILFATTSFGQKFGFNDLLNSAPDDITVFCIPNNSKNSKALENDGINVKFFNSQWLFINSTPRWINENMKNNRITDYYFEYAPPVALADSARGHHFVNQVHNGDAPLESSYTGAGVIVGVVDQGLDFTHPDFLDDNGKTRVLRYWDHTMNGPNSPAPYGYGQIWDSTQINAGTCTSTEEASAHGTTVTGMAVGDGSANNSNKGMAPDANIIVVETNFNLPNWTLTVADAVDYIFKVADTLNMPAVVNLSLGSYLGSHDGNDPASEYIETLLDEKPGRIVVSAAGNSGAKGNYHQQHSPSAIDTNFVWLLNNPSAVIAPNTIFFDLWTDIDDTTFIFALGADSPAPSYNFRGRTNFHAATENLVSPVLDTIWNGTNRIATIETYCELVDNNYHMQMFVSNVDSLDYLYRFETSGSGKYDLWSGGAWLGYNDMVSAIPTSVEMPAITKYILPDSNQTIVSSWNCSEKVVSVGNMKNRHQFIDNNLNPAVSSHPNPVGSKSPNSSLGPNRHDLTKPDVIASGDHTLAAGPMWALPNPAYNFMIDSGGMHMLNGGTSMASPVVAGIAALYLERCNYATYDQFLADIHNTAYADIHTGTVPNNAYGYGKPNAYDLLQELTLETQPVVTLNYGSSTIQSSSSDQYQWYVDGSSIMNETNQDHAPQSPYGDYTVMTINLDGCHSISDPIAISAGIKEKSTSLLISPNPSMDFVKIETERVVKKVYAIDANGKSMLLTPNSDNLINISNLSSGIYNLRIVTETGIFHSKLIRQ